jgi:hypothetical protein
MIYQRPTTGETLTEPTGYHGLETNTFLNIVEAAGLTELPVQSLTESTSSETELGLT